MALIMVATSCSAPTQHSAQSHLTVTIRADGEKISAQHTLVCHGDKASSDSTLPQAPLACASLEKLAELVNSSPNSATVCTEIYGGPQRAHVSGLLHGQSIVLDFSRTNGCLINQWDAASFLLETDI